LADLELDESGYTAMWQQDKSIEAPGRLENLKELIHAMEEFENLGGFLEHVSLVMENTEASDRDQLSIMTLHGAKGLEFDVVFLPGWEEGLFPHQRSLDENGMKGLEEERRLAYVGLTRARRFAQVSHAANRRIHNQWQSALPSRFLAELPKENIERREDNTFHSRREMGFGAGFGSGLSEAYWPRSSSFAERMARRAAPTIEGKAIPVAENTGKFSAGSRVFHQKFGYGAVVAAEGDKLEIAFDKAGRKRVMADFVVPADMAG
jgi:DNA helicase-2/ATP-dependent DNA helicase PcrA